MIYKFNKLSFFLLSIIILASCGTTNDNESRDEDAALLKESASVVLKDPITAIAFVYKVSSWEEWKEKFDDDKEARADRGMETLGILVSTENSKEVTVFIRTLGHEESVTYTTSDEMQRQMVSYGVIGDPELFFFDIVEMPEREFPQKYRFMISHDVKDYEFWKQKFDEHNPDRLEAGLEVAGIARGYENPDNVSVMFAFDDMDEARLFAESEELKSSMEVAGVVGDPVIYWLSVPPEQ